MTMRLVIKVNLKKIFLLGLISLHTMLIFGCIYTMDIQQGNLLDEESIGQVELNMTSSQVKFLLGTPIIQDSFHQNRWDYVYYLKLGNSNNLDKRWLAIHFSDDKVIKIEKVLIINTSIIY